MRIVNRTVCAILILFTLVQYNDPDFYFWMPVYALGALWAGLAARRPERLSRPLPATLLGAALAAATAGTWWFWPREQGFWQQSVWWESETAREGMGMMVVTVALLLVVATVIAASRKRPESSG